MSRKNDPIFAEKVQILYQNIPGAILPAFAGTLIYGGVVWTELPHWRVIIWGLFNCLSFFGRYYLYWQYKKLKQPVQNPEKWFTGLASLTYFSGAIWGSIAFFLLPEALPYHLLAAAFIAGFMAGAAGFHSIIPEVVTGFTFLAAAPLCVRFYFIV